MSLVSGHSPEEARRVLEVAEGTRSRFLEAVLYGRIGAFLCLWGAVWMIGFMGLYLYPERATTLWLLVTGLGWLSTIALAWRQRTVRRERGIQGFRYVISAMILSFYAVLWAVVLPWDSPNAASVYAGTVTGFGYLVVGIWRGHRLIWLGAAVTALFLVGVVAAPMWFPLLAAVAGGGGLIAAGLLFLQQDPTEAGF